MGRKGSGPRRSSSPLNDFLQPGVIFKISPTGQAKLCTSGLSLKTACDSSETEESTADETIPINSIASSKLYASSSARKKCASCSVRRTPYWREGWREGVLLCNACGIRFHKYRKYCNECNCIAKKDETGHLHCPKCLTKL